jgi:hypothetical protein
MHDSGAPEWREVLHKHHSAMVDELSAALDSDLQHAVSEALTEERARAARQIAGACEDARRSHAESLNQALRRLREADSDEKILQLLNDSCAPHTRQSVVLVFENNQARTVASRGVSHRGGADATFAIDAAPAILAAIDSRDPVVALASGEQISGTLATRFESEEGDEEYAKAYLFPIVVRHAAVALLIASGEVASAPVELLCEAAAMRLEGRSEQVSASIPRAGSPEKRAWDELSSEDQALHLQAQRKARVRVAEIRLACPNELTAGLARSDVYGALKAPLDAARQQFLQEFLSKSPSMVDYLHLEISRSLVNDNDRLLGSGYPGPMV